MANSNALHSNSAVSSNGITNCFRTVHDTGYGLFKGMITTALELVKPFAVKAEQAYVENYRWANTGGAAATGLGGVMYFCYSPWSCIWTIATVVPSIYLGHRITQSYNSVHAVNPEVIAESAVTDDFRLRTGSHREDVSLPASVAALDHCSSCSSNLSVKVGGTLSEKGSKEISATELVKVFRLVEKNTFNLMQMTDDLVDRQSVILTENICRGAAFSPDIVVMARKELKPRFFQALLLFQVTYGDISLIVRDILKGQNNYHITRLCDSENVDIERLTEHFLNFARNDRRETDLIKDGDSLAFLLNKATNALIVSPLEEGGAVRVEGRSNDEQRAASIKGELERCLLEHCKKVKALILKRAGSQMSQSNTYSTLSAPVTDGSASGGLRQRRGSRQDSTS